MVTLYYTESAGMSDDVFHRWLPRLAPEKAERLCRMGREDSRTSLAGELLARYGLWKTFGIPPTDVVIRPDKLGKPQVLSHAGVHFNVSHTGFQCICAVADRPVGVDLQAMKPVRHGRLAERFFTPEEQAAYGNLGGTEDAFYTVWARKEALGKLTGYGLRPGSPAGQGVVVLEENFQNCKICVACSP